MTNMKKRDEIFNTVWKACGTFRGVIDPSQYKDYILTMLFVKYLSDIRKTKLAEYDEKYKGDKIRVERAMSRERFIIKEDCTFDYLSGMANSPALFNSGGCRTVFRYNTVSNGMMHDQGGCYNDFLKIGRAACRERV